MNKIHEVLKRLIYWGSRSKEQATCGVAPQFTWRGYQMLLNMRVSDLLKEITSLYTLLFFSHNKNLRKSFNVFLWTTKEFEQVHNARVQRWLRDRCLARSCRELQQCHQEDAGSQKWVSSFTLCLISAFGIVLTSFSSQVDLLKLGLEDVDSRR